MKIELLFLSFIIIIMLSFMIANLHSFPRGVFTLFFLAKEVLDKTDLFVVVVVVVVVI